MEHVIQESFQATIREKCAPLLMLEENVKAMTTEMNAVIIETASDILGKHRRKSQPWGLEEILEMFDIRDFKKEKNMEEVAAKYIDISNKIRKGMAKAKEDWIEERCMEIEDCLSNNNSKRAYQVVKELAKESQHHSRQRRGMPH